MRDAIDKRIGAIKLGPKFPDIVSNAVDYVLDAVRTGRTRISELDSVEKTFIGLKVEHFVRDWLDVPTGIRDLNIDGYDVDVKNTIGDNWMIPPETYQEHRGDGIEKGGTCLLIRMREDDELGQCWLGLIRIRDKYLNKPNRDGKRSISASGKLNIMWLVEGDAFQAGYWQSINMQRFRELRGMYGGNNRVIAFFSENLGKVVHRSVVLSLLHDQLDPMKRLRWNSGAKGKLWDKEIVLLSGMYFRELADLLGSSNLARDQFVAFAVDYSGRRKAEQYNYLADD